MKFDGTISLGNLLSIGTVVVGLSLGYANIQAQQAEATRRIVQIEAAATSREARLREVEIVQASQSSDLRNIQKTLEEIKALIVSQRGDQP